MRGVLFGAENSQAALRDSLASVQVELLASANMVGLYSMDTAKSDSCRPSTSSKAGFSRHIQVISKICDGLWNRFG